MNKVKIALLFGACICISMVECFMAHAGEPEKVAPQATPKIVKQAHEQRIAHLADTLLPAIKESIRSLIGTFVQSAYPLTTPEERKDIDAIITAINNFLGTRTWQQVLTEAQAVTEPRESYTESLERIQKQVDENPEMQQLENQIAEVKKQLNNTKVQQLLNTTRQKAPQLSSPITITQEDIKQYKKLYDDKFALIARKSNLEVSLLDKLMDEQSKPPQSDLDKLAATIQSIVEKSPLKHTLEQVFQYAFEQRATNLGAQLLSTLFDAIQQSLQKAKAGQ